MPYGPVATYPGGGQRVSVESSLKQPRVIARALTDLANKRFVADRIFASGTADQIAGGAAVYQKSESIYPERDVEEVGVRAEYPRTVWSEELFAAYVKKYGLEVPISDEAKRRNAMDYMARGQRKLANALVKFVDTEAMTLLTSDAGISTTGASGDWSTAATDIVADIASARKVIFDQDEGYEPDTLIVNPAQELDMIVDASIRDALPREGGPSNAVITGRPVPILGLRQILVTPRLAAGTVFLLDMGTIGSIADERPLPDENYSGYDPGAGQATLYVKTYREENTDETIVRCARFPAMWIAEPKSAFKITGA